MKIRQSCCSNQWWQDHILCQYDTAQIHLFQEHPWAPSAIHELTPSANIHMYPKSHQKATTLLHWWHSSRALSLFTTSPQGTHTHFNCYAHKVHFTKALHHYPIIWIKAKTCEEVDRWGRWRRPLAALHTIGSLRRVFCVQLAVACDVWTLRLVLSRESTYAISTGETYGYPDFSKVPHPIAKIIPLPHLASPKVQNLCHDIVWPYNLYKGILVVLIVRQKYTYRTSTTI